MSTPFSHFFHKINHFSPLEADFTEVLESIALMPKMLYLYGKLPENVAKNDFLQKPSVKTGSSSKVRIQRPKTVAIVGSRHSTRYGEEVAYRLAYELARRGVVIVSGLAYGIDSVGHRGCLDAGGVTIAVLGTPIDRIYPRSHLGLARDILEHGGGILSEYAPRTEDYQFAPLAYGEAGLINGKWITPGRLERMRDVGDVDELHYEQRRIDPKYSFLYRNRLISGLSDIVVVVEAAERSGSLSTATHALEQGKTVFAVPGNITSPYSQGCNKLIFQGANVYTQPEDILRELFPEDYITTGRRSRQTQLSGDNDIESAILQTLSQGINHGDDIIKATHLPPEVFGQTITLLEIKGRVHGLGGNHWGLA